MTDVEKVCVVESVLRVMLLGLIDQPRAMAVGVEVDGRHVRFEVRVAAQDVGKVIGKQGRTARSLRTILSGCAMKLTISTDLNIVDMQTARTEVSDGNETEA